MSWSADDGTGGTRRSRPGRSHSAAVTDWLGRTSSVPSSRHTGHGGGSYPAQSLQLQQQQEQARLVLTLTGWRRRALFGLLLTLTVIVIINLSLTLWLLRSMQFSLDGIGNMKITPSGIQLNGEAMVLDTLITSQISAKQGHPLVFDSNQNITLNARDAQGRIANKIFLGEDRLEVVARDFRVTNSRQELLFAANRKEVVVGADILRVSGVGGAVFEGSIQTPLVRAESGNDLRLESATRTLQMQAPQGVALESQAGDISATSYEDLRLWSTGGSIRIDSSSVMLPNIRTALVTSKSQRPSSSGGSYNNQHQTSRSSTQIYQVCVCSNGRLFLSPPHGSCVADGTICA
ncbi:zeta-sarcoglycan-like [Daphnia pulicaria]|uniref:zeta-sarcoglycan-like n=1 Tax=Daphnia pulicaria TaxID=35523 RepID=UPI001EECA34A|nr:zeta-sarcoglycan-like [Daphnia pulicaria]